MFSPLSIFAMLMSKFLAPDSSNLAVLYLNKGSISASMSNRVTSKFLGSFSNVLSPPENIIPPPWPLLTTFLPG